MKAPLILWLNQRLPWIARWQHFLRHYRVPSNLNAYYCFGILAIVALCMQWISGLWLTMFYTPTTLGAFDSIENMMRNVPWGWLLRYCHSTGASAIFIVLYVHIFRGLLYGSYQKPRELVWIFGCFLFLILMLEAFMGYVLPWGQMSYWSAQVLTSLLGVVPLVGHTLLVWVRGGDLVNDALLHRFFALHVIAIPVLVFVLSYLHVVSLHHVGSNNPEGFETRPDGGGQHVEFVLFYPRFVWKDLLAVLIFLSCFFAIVFFCPDLHGFFLESSNFSKAQPLMTPSTIRVLWYLSPFYAMLRAIPHPLGGLFVFICALGVWLFLPWLDRSAVRSMRYKGPVSRIALGFFVFNFIVLCALGLMNLSPLTYTMAQCSTVYYFAYFLLMPLYTRYERVTSCPESCNA